MFTEADRIAIAEAVRMAEQRTSAEIIPVAATASGRYDRAEDVFGLLVALVLVSAAWLGFQDVATSGWGAALRINLPVVLLLFIAGFIFGSAAATWLPALKLPFITRIEIDQELQRSAAAAFHRFKLRHTGAGNGVLLYISLFEHRVLVLPDDTVAAEISPESWNEVCDLIVVGLREGRAADGLQQAIARCGEILAVPCPPQAADRDELPNQLRIID